MALFQISSAKAISRAPSCSTGRHQPVGAFPRQDPHTVKHSTRANLASSALFRMRDACCQIRLTISDATTPTAVADCISAVEKVLGAQL